MNMSTVPFHTSLIAVIASLSPEVEDDILRAKYRVAEALEDTDVPAKHLNDVEQALDKKIEEMDESDASYAKDIHEGLLRARDALTNQIEAHRKSQNGKATSDAEMDAAGAELAETGEPEFTGAVS